MPASLTSRLEDNVRAIGERLGWGESFDVLIRRVEIAGRGAALIFIDGFVKEDILTLILKTLSALQRRDLALDPLLALSRRWLPFIETSTVTEVEAAIHQVLAGPLVLLLDGVAEAVVIDARQYPTRGMTEPELERVIRGSRDGFVETIVFNTALIRRRLRDPGLRVRLFNVGRRSRTDVALLYINDIACPDMVRLLCERIQAVDVDGLPMGEKSLEEFLVGRSSWWNPFPVVRYTERPDVAAVHLLEGHLAVVVDTSPSIALLPITIFHHMQHAADYREDPMVGAYMRWVRGLGIGLSWVGPPLWVALTMLEPGNGVLPPWLGPREPAAIALPLQFIMAELGLDLVRLALIHTPAALGTALGLIGAVILGQIAIEVGLFAPETILYTAIAAIGTFATPSVEFAMAVRLTRVALLILVAAAGWPGLAAGAAVLGVILARMRSFGVPYLWPLWPLDLRSLLSILVRTPAPHARLRPRFLRPGDPDRMRRRAHPPAEELPPPGEDGKDRASPPSGRQGS
ncbi:MAG TPA: spore germination protein [Bacillota bacterium]|nr:spore germination protein [Bacillota bacterium]